MKIGVVVLGVASIAAGILDLIWGEFEAAHQPIQALAEHIPGVTFFAYVTAVWLIAGGAAILFDRTARIGAVTLAVIYTARSSGCRALSRRRATSDTSSAFISACWAGRERS